MTLLSRLVFPIDVSKMLDVTSYQQSRDMFAPNFPPRSFGGGFTRASLLEYAPEAINLVSRFSRIFFFLLFTLND